MKKLYAILITITVSASSINAQTILTGGFGTDGMGVVNGTAYAKTGTLGSGGFPFVSAAKDGGAFYASVPGISKLYFINAAGTSFTDSMTVKLSRISSSNEADILFGNTATSLVRINTATKSVVDSLVLGAPWEIAERPNAKEVWVTDSGKVHIVDYTSALNPTTITVAASPYDYSKVAFTPAGSMAYKGASNGKMLYKINAATKAILDSVSTAPYGFSNMVVSHDSSKLFICSPDNNMVMIYNTSDLSLLDSVSYPTRTPLNIYRHPSRQEIWVVHHFNDSVSVFNENTKAQIAAFNISGSPWYIAFGSATTSVNNIPLSSINIYPNPARDEITLNGLEAGDNVSVVDVLGAEVISATANSKQQRLNIGMLKTGNYIIRITGKYGNTKTSSLFEKI